MATPTVTVIGNLTADPQLRTTNSGKQVANLRIAATDRRRNPQTNGWEDGDKLFIDGTLWGQEAANAAQSLAKGMRVIAVGRLKTRSYTAQDGQSRTVTELALDDVAPSLRTQTAVVSRITADGRPERQQAGFQTQPQAQQGYAQPAYQPQPYAPQNQPMQPAPAQTNAEPWSGQPYEGDPQF